MLLYTGSSLSCYQCDSNEDADCTEYFDHEHFADLTIRSTECAVDAAKYCIKTTGVWGGVVGTTRFCSSRDMGNQCQFVRYPDHDRVYRACIYTCRTDNCNSSGYISINLFVLGAALFSCLLHLVSSFQ
ncbi:hypothetical protein LSH36_26g00008 [Paralvinella palmiformis]|uniref:Protein sleepless n=1 Tax=Paralvinella palmiformis TaxID=53620 RepID=A0AAD9KAK2_9ANNE|nr:hypothetical protein LSH36_26g00008 [Paralvinella palmiformis]